MVLNVLSFHVQKSTLSDKPAADADQYSGLRNVRGVCYFCSSHGSTFKSHQFNLELNHSKDNFFSLFSTEVKREKIIEYMMKGSKSGATPSTPVQQKEREKRVEDIRKDMLEKFRIVDI